MAGALTARRVQPQEKREVAFVVRAPDANNRGRWVTVGVAFARKNDEPGFSIELNTLPVGTWDGTLILLPPLAQEEEQPKE
jgi:hypothetical protein